MMLSTPEASFKKNKFFDVLRVVTTEFFWSILKLNEISLTHFSLDEYLKSRIECLK